MVGAIALGAFVGMLDATIVAVALGPITRRFALPLASGQEVIAIYLVVVMATLPTIGRLSDRFGRRPVILASIFGLGLHYLLLALAPSLWFMLIARVIGGVTGASFSVANAYASDISSAESRAKSFGLIGAAFGLGFIFGPMLGGLLGTIDLHLPFYVAAGLSLANFGSAFVILPESLAQEHRTARPLWDFSHIGDALRDRRLAPLMAAWAIAPMSSFNSVLSASANFAA